MIKQSTILSQLGGAYHVAQKYDMMITRLQHVLVPKDVSGGVVMRMALYKRYYHKARRFRCCHCFVLGHENGSQGIWQLSMTN